MTGYAPLLFDETDSGREPFRDEQGMELPDLKAARFEALDIAKDELPDGDVRSFVIDIREGEGPIVLTASLSLRVEQKG
jgi:hypothetical protein